MCVGLPELASAPGYEAQCVSLSMPPLRYPARLTLAPSSLIFPHTNQNLELVCDIEEARLTQVRYYLISHIENRGASGMLCWLVLRALGACAPEGGLYLRPKLSVPLMSCCSCHGPRTQLLLGWIPSASLPCNAPFVIPPDPDSLAHRLPTPLLHCSTCKTEWLPSRPTTRTPSKASTCTRVGGG